jgi:tetratricopeptide (TPR) repeat protein
VTPERFETIKRLVLAAEDIPEPEREAWIDRECGGDAALRDEVASLMSADVPSIMRSGGLAARIAALDPGREPDGHHIGPYRITGVLGEGGMGIVYRAEQTSPLRRDVALKLVPAGLDSARIVSRFSLERQTLARMNHPYIAQVFDAGADDRGRPYFAMELVEGEPITEYCAREAPPLETRLQLFLRICEAVQHAHQRGIIHRDLKPSNVLLTRRGAELVPKVIDFGIAKAAGDTGSEPLTTMAGQMMGTPEYMSPEQAGLIDAGVDTRADVYALGVMLYELLSGHRPYSLQKRTVLELERAMRTPPAPPSQRADTSRAAGRDALRDLDAVALAALERNPDDRYASVEQLADDVRRVMEHRPVLARQATPGYRARKFVRRHAAVVATAALIVVLVATGVVAVVMQRNRALASESRAIDEAARAHVEAEKASAVARFLTDLFRESDPANARGAAVTARELLDRGVQRLSTDLTAQPPTRATLLATIGGVYRVLGLHDESERAIKGALEIRRTALGPAHPDLADSLDELGELARERTRYEEAVTHHRAALAIRRAALAPDDPALAESLSNLALALRERGQYDEAEPLVREALAIRRARLGPDDTQTLASLTVLGDITSSRGRFAEAETIYEEVLEARRRTLPPNHPRLAGTLNNVASMRHRAGKFAEAEPLYREALAIRRKVLDPDHLDVTTSMLNLAGLLQDLGRLDEAEPLMRGALEADRRKNGSMNMDVAIDLNNLASLLEDKGQFEEAAKLYEESKTIRIALQGEQSSSVATVLSNIGRMQLMLRSLGPAEASLRRAIEIRRALKLDQHPRQGDTTISLGRLLEARGRFAEAEEMYRAALAIFRAATPAGSAGAASAQVSLGHLLVQTKQAAAAEPMLREALDFRRQRLPAGHRAIGDAEAALGEALMHLSRPAEAEPLLRSALQTAPPGPTPLLYGRQAVLTLLNAAASPPKAP